MQRGSGQNAGRVRFVLGTALAALVAVSVGACVAASTPTPQPPASADASLVESPSGSDASPVETSADPTSTPEPSLVEEPEPTPTPMPPPPNGPLPSVGAAPAGTWTGIKWIALPGGHYPAVPSGNDYVYSTAMLEGWSKGYVEFLWDPHRRTIAPWVSANGLTWKAGTKLNLGAWAGDFAAWDAQLAQNEADPEGPDYHDTCTVTVSGFEEGPATLLLRAYFECAGGCGGPWFTSSEALWTSPDGRAWTALDPKAAFGVNGAGTISGGSSGFISLGELEDKPVDWISQDGQNWTRGTLPTGSVSLSAPVAFAGGYVFPGVVVVRKGHESLMGPGTCGWGTSTIDQSKYEGALWWSQDGVNWTRDSLTGTIGFGVDMSVSRIDDHTLLAIETTWDSDGEMTGEVQWLSKDGKTWTRRNVLASTYQYWGNQILEGRDHGLMLDVTTSTSGEDEHLLRAIDAKLTPITVSQSGDMPWEFGVDLAIGPTGILASADGQRFWIGVPTAG